MKSDSDPHRPSWAPAFRFRETVRALILTAEPSLLLLHLVMPDRDLWITPGGGIAPGESHRDALRRELREEVGRDDLEIGPRVWVRHGRYRWAGEWVDEREHFYLIRTEPFHADGSMNPVVYEREALAEMRWWRVADLPAESKGFAPIRLGALAAELVQRGPPPEPIETGY